MSEQPRVSVVVPTYDRRPHLEQLLPHLEERAGPEVEVVIVDDGSSDGTSGLLRSVSWAVTTSQPNGGPAAARNTGWRLARAPVVAFLDDDCTPGSGWPLGLLDAFEDDRVGGVGGQVVGRDRSTLGAYVEVERLVDHGRDVDDGVDYLITANAAYRRSVLEELGGFDEAFPSAAGEDVDLSWRARDAGWRLVRSDVPVEHDHRTGVREVLRTHRAHGRARALLDTRHPGRPASASASRALAPGVWRDRWDGYRSRGVGVIRRVGLLALRAAGLAGYAIGLRQGRRG